jgi:hypothetical protein
MGNIHSINIGGSTYVIEPNFVKILDKRDTVAHAPSYYGGQRLTASFENNGGPTSGWNSMLSIYGWQGNDYKVWQIGSNADNNTTDQNLYFRTSNSITNNTWHPWKRVITDKDAATSASSIYVTYNPSSNNSYSVPFMDSGHTQNSKIYSDNTFKYNPGTNTLTATKFAGTATNAQQAGKIAIHTMKHIISSGICPLDGMYEVPVILGGCDCTIFSDQIDVDYYALTTDYHPQTNNSNWLRYNFNDQILKSANFEGNLIGTATNANAVKVTATSNSANYPLILGPSTTAGVTVSTSYKSLYTDSVNYLYYNPNTNTLTAPNFVGNFIGNADTATTAKTTYLTYIKCETTTNQSYLINFGNTKTGDTYTYSSSKLTFNPSTGELQTYNLRLKNSGNYGSYLKFGDNNYCYIWESPDDTLRIHSSNGLYVTNNVTATNFAGTGFYGNLIGNATGNLTGRLLPKTTNTTAIEMTYTGVSGIEYHSNINRHANGSNYYAGTAYGFPALSNANGVLNIETHPFGGASYYLHQIGFSSDNGLYHRAFHGNNPKSASSTPSNQNGKTWNSIPLGKPSNYGQVRNIEVVTSMPSTPNSYTLYLVLG